MNVYTCEERITAIEADKVRETLLSLLRRGDKVIVDMNECRYISSAAIRTFLIVTKAAPQYGANLVFVNLNDEIRNVLDLTGMLELLKIE